MFKLKLEHLAHKELEMYCALLGGPTYDVLAHMDVQCHTKIKSVDSDISEHDVVPVPNALIQACMCIIEWQCHIHTTQACLCPSLDCATPLPTAGDTSVVENVAMAANPNISSELCCVSPLADPTDMLALFHAVGLLSSEYMSLTCHHSERPIHCVMTKANRHIGRPFLMCPFARSPSDRCAWLCWTDIPVVGQPLQAPDDFEPSARDYTLLLCPAEPDKHIGSAASRISNTLKVAAAVTAGAACFGACSARSACHACTTRPAHGLPRAGKVGGPTLPPRACAHDTRHPRLGPPRTHTHGPPPVRRTLPRIGEHEYPLWTVGLDRPPPPSQSSQRRHLRRALRGSSPLDAHHVPPQLHPDYPRPRPPVHVAGRTLLAWLSSPA